MLHEIAAPIGDFTRRLAHPGPAAKIANQKWCQMKALAKLCTLVILVFLFSPRPKYFKSYCSLVFAAQKCCTFSSGKPTCVMWIWGYPQMFGQTLGFGPMVATNGTGSPDSWPETATCAGPRALAANFQGMGLGPDMSVT